ERSHLRDAARRARLPRRALDGPARQAVCRAGGIEGGARGLSGADPQLDRPPRRLDVADAAAARAGARGDLSELQVVEKLRGGLAEPTDVPHACGPPKARK